MRCKVVALVFGLFLLGGSASAKEKYAPLPDRIIEAKTVFVDNGTGYAHSGDVIFQFLTDWKRFKVVSDKKDADLVFVLTGETHEAMRGGTAVTNQIGTTKIPTGGGFALTASEVVLRSFLGS